MSAKSKSNERFDLLKHWQEDVPQDRLAHLVRDTARAYSRSLQWRLAQYGVAFGHWTFLRILWQKDGLTQRELSLRAGVMEPTTYSALKTMQGLGYIEIRHLGQNKKNKHVFLTPLGQALRQQLVPLAQETNQISVKGLSKEEVLLARKVLLQLLHNLVHDQAQEAELGGHP
jgi:MarR family transcriptional regulator, organic hydroperoxide resistance regulator